MPAQRPPRDGGVGEKLVLLVIFAALVGVGAVLLLRAGRSMRLGTVLVRIQDTTAEIRVRFAVLLLVALVALAGHLGLETILGAFLAGAIVGLVDRDSSTHPHFRIKLEAIGYAGFGPSGTKATSVIGPSKPVPSVARRGPNRDCRPVHRRGIVSRRGCTRL